MGLDLYDPKSFLTKKMSDQKKFPFNKIVLPIFFPDHQKSNFFSTTIFFTQIFLRPKFFLTQIFFRLKFFRPKFFSDQKLFLTKIFLRPKFFSDQIIFPTKFVFQSKLFRPKIFLNRIFFWPQIFVEQNLFWPTNSQTEICFLPNFFFRTKICFQTVRPNSFSNQPNWLWHKSKITLLIRKIDPKKSLCAWLINRNVQLFLERKFWFGYMQLVSFWIWFWKSNVYCIGWTDNITAILLFQIHIQKFQ